MERYNFHAMLRFKHKKYKKDIHVHKAVCILYSAVRI